MMRSNNRKFWRKICSISLLIGILWLALAGCAQQKEQNPPEVLFTATPGITPTPTIIWFPTNILPTLHPISTATPNPAATPEFGKLIFSDSFTGDGEWQNSQASNGLIIVKDGVLTLAVKSAQGSLATFRQNTSLDNFYLETTANVGLCKQDDQIGVLFRTNSEQSFYRFIINCQGNVSLQQVLGGVPVILQDWTPSVVQPGLYRNIKIGIWQSGSQIRIYLDDQLQLEATSDLFKSGGIGFYAHAGGGTPLTVSFTSLNVFNLLLTNVGSSTAQVSQ